MHDKKTCGRPDGGNKHFIQDFGRRIRSVRLEHNIPLAEFARALHMNEKTLIRIENGSMQPDGWLMFILESSLSINVNWLMTGEGEMMSGKGGNRKELAQLLAMYKRLSRNSQDRILSIIKMLIHSDHGERLKRLACANHDD